MVSVKDLRRLKVVQNESGFTALEALIVIVCVVILVALVLILRGY